MCHWDVGDLRIIFLHAYMYIRGHAYKCTPHAARPATAVAEDGVFVAAESWIWQSLLDNHEKYEHPFTLAHLAWQSAAERVIVLPCPTMSSGEYCTDDSKQPERRMCISEGEMINANQPEKVDPVVQENWRCIPQPCMLSTLFTDNEVPRWVISNLSWNSAGLTIFGQLYPAGMVTVLVLREDMPIVASTL